MMAVASSLNNQKQKLKEVYVGNILLIRREVNLYLQCAHAHFSLFEASLQAF